jgi:hypothetical protein
VKKSPLPPPLIGMKPLPREVNPLFVLIAMKSLLREVNQLFALIAMKPLLRELNQLFSKFCWVHLDLTKLLCVFLLHIFLGKFSYLSSIGLDYCVDFRLRHSAQVVRSFNIVCCHSNPPYVCVSFSEKK